MSSKVLQRAVLHHRQGQFEQAKALYQRLHERERGHLEALCLLGSVESELRHFEAAIVIFRRALSVNPRYASAHSSIGNAQVSLAEYEALALAATFTFAAEA